MGIQATTDFPNYAPGSWGPAEADELLRRDGYCEVTWGSQSWQPILAAAFLGGWTRSG